MGFRSKHTIRRTTGTSGFDYKGNPKAPVTQDIIISIGIQPLNKDESQQYVDLLNSGGRRMQALKGYTKFEVYPTRESKQGQTAQQADVLIYNGRQYACITCDPWQSGIMSHYKAIFKEVPS